MNRLSDAAVQAYLRFFEVYLPEKMEEISKLPEKGLHFDESLDDDDDFDFVVDPTDTDDEGSEQ